MPSQSAVLSSGSANSFRMNQVKKEYQNFITTTYTEYRTLKELKTLGKVKRWFIVYPHELNARQMSNRYEISLALLLCNRDESFPDRIMTCDVKWILYNNKRRFAQWLDKY